MLLKLLVFVLLHRLVDAHVKVEQDKLAIIQRKGLMQEKGSDLIKRNELLKLELEQQALRPFVTVC